MGKISYMEADYLLRQERYLIMEIKTKNIKDEILPSAILVKKESPTRVYFFEPDINGLFLEEDINDLINRWKE